MKIAVYVEGQAELIFVRELLCRWFQYDSAKLALRCYNLFGAEPPGCETDYCFDPLKTMDAIYNYYIINVGNDASVLSKAIKNARRHIDLGFSSIVALRDMFCDHYHEMAYKSRKPRTIIPELNSMFIEGAENTIAKNKYAGFININFAIMEVEAWFLGMGWFFKKVDSKLTQDYLRNSFGLDLDADVETNEYHPVNLLDRIYKSIGRGYGKHASEVNSIMGHLEKSDFEMLLSLPQCNSFNHFMANLIPEE